MLPLLPVIGALCAFLTFVGARSSTGTSVLVVMEPQLKREDYSIFFGGLEKRGYELTFRAPKDTTPLAIEHDVPQFAHVILFAPTSKAFAADLTPQSLVTLLGANTNVIFALSPTQTPLYSLASEFSLSLPPPLTPLISHFPERDGPHTVIPVTVPASHPILTPKTPPVIFSGVPHILGNNPLLVPILRAPAESFATDTSKDSESDAVVDASDKGGEGLWAGSQLGLVSGFQVSGGARALWVGGVEVFSNAYASQEALPGIASGNAQFSQDIAAWTFQETMVLRIDKTSHRRASGGSESEFYTTKDEVVFTVDISKYDPSTKQWKPYSDIKDLQLEFTMLDPHIRTALSPVASSPGAYEAKFRVPDRHGVFKFIVDYKRKGLTHLHSATVVSVVPPRHDEYPRFLSAAWPYYAGAVSTSVGFVLFSILWLGGDVAEKRKGKGKEE